MTPGTVYRQFKCGCIYDIAEEIPRTRIDERTESGQKRQVLLCPVHKERLLRLFKTCPVCKEKFTAEVDPETGYLKNGVKPGHCHACGREKAAKKKEAKPLVTTKDIAVSRERFDCVHRNDCLTSAAMRSDDVLPCIVCCAYTPEPIRPDLISTYDPYQWAYGDAEVV